MSLHAFAAERRAASPLLLSAVQWISGDHFHLFAFSSPPISRYLLPAWRSAANPQERRAADGPTDT